MPLVSSASSSCKPELELVRQGHISKIAAFIPGDNASGESIPAVFSNFNHVSKQVYKHGIGLDADVRFCLAPGEEPPRKYGEVGKDGVVRQVHIHLCSKKTCTSHAAKVHLGEWAYVGSNEEGLGEAETAALAPDLRILLTALKQPLAAWEDWMTPVKQPVQRSAPAGYLIGTPKPPTAPPGLPVDLVRWAQEHDVPEIAEVLARQKIRRPAELGALTDGDIEILFTVEPCDLGVKSRFRMAVGAMRKAAAASVAADDPSCWVEAATGVELPKSQVRGLGLGGPECLLDDDSGIGFIQLPRRGWVKLRRKGFTAGPPPRIVDVDDEREPSGFAEPGPLEQLAQTA